METQGLVTRFDSCSRYAEVNNAAKTRLVFRPAGKAANQKYRDRFRPRKKANPL